MSEYLRSAIIVRYGNRNIVEYIPLDPWSTLSNRVKFYQIAFWSENKWDIPLLKMSSQRHGPLDTTVQITEW